MRGVTVACLVASVTVYFWAPVQPIRLPRSVAIMDWLLLLAFVAGARLLARTVMERPAARGIVDLVRHDLTHVIKRSFRHVS